MILRLAVGLAVAAHGSQKLFGWFGGYGLAGTGGFFEQALGYRPGKLFAAAAGTNELLGGLLIAAGFLGAVGPMLVVATMLTAILTVHLKHGFFVTNNGIEMPFTYGVAAIAIALAGYGGLSLDGAWGITALSQPVVTWALLGLGAIGGAVMSGLRHAPQPQSQPAS